MSTGAALTGDNKRWNTLRAAAALRGLSVLRTDAADGQVRVVALRGRQAFVVETLDQLEAQLVGTPHKN